MRPPLCRVVTDAKLTTLEVLEKSAGCNTYSVISGKYHIHRKSHLGLDSTSVTCCLGEALPGHP